MYKQINPAEDNPFNRSWLEFDDKTDEIIGLRIYGTTKYTRVTQNNKGYLIETHKKEDITNTERKIIPLMDKHPILEKITKPIKELTLEEKIRLSEEL